MHVFPLRSIACAASLLFVIVLGGAGCRSSDVAAPTPTPIPRLPSGVVEVTNNSLEPLDVTVLEVGTGKKVTLVVPSLRRADVLVLEGDAHVTGISRRDGSTVLDQTVHVTDRKPAPIHAKPANWRMPGQLSMTKTNDPTVHTSGVLECTGAAGGIQLTTAASRLTQGGTAVAATTYAFQCNDPKDATLATKVTVGFTYANTDLANGAMPDPLRACKFEFDAFTRKSTAASGTPKAYFRMKFDRNQVTCAAAPSPIALVAREAPVLAGVAKGGVGVNGYPIAIQSFGTLTIKDVHPSDPDMKDGYTSWDTSATAFSGESKENDFTLRYQFQTLDPTSIAHYAVQIAAVPTTPDPNFPCKDWDKLFLGSAQTLDALPNLTTGGLYEVQLPYSLNHLAQGGLYYVRVVPIDANGQCVIGASNWVTFLGGDPDPYTTIANAPKPPYNPDDDPANRAYTVGVVSYQPPVYGDQKVTVGHIDAHMHTIVTKDNPWHLPLGCTFVPDATAAPSAPWYDQLGQAVVSACDFVASAYDDIKSSVVDLVASAIPDCGDTCKQGLTMGLDVGLAAIGLPPEIPNADQLIQSGGDYLAEMAADQAGVPVELVKPLSDHLVSDVQSALASPGPADASDPSTFGKPDPWFDLQAPVLYVQITRDPDPSKYTGAGIDIVSEDDIWKTRTIWAPGSLPPGGSVIVPVVLEPLVHDFPGETEDPDYNDAIKFDNWFTDRFQSGTAWMKISVEGARNSVLFQSVAGAPVGDYGKVTQSPDCPPPSY